MNSGKHTGVEECSASNPGKNAKLDKASILSDATRMLTQLRGETEKLKESNSNLRETIKDLKVPLFPHHFASYCWTSKCLTPSTHLFVALKVLLCHENP